MHNANHQRYMNKIRSLLLGANREGISQYDLNQATRTKHFNVSAMLQILEEWERKQWVQSFKVRIYGKRPTTMWRATTLLVEGFQNVHLRGITPHSVMVEPSEKEELEIDAFRYRT